MDFGLHKRGQYWHYRFSLNGTRYRGSTKATSKGLAAEFTKNLYHKLYRQKNDILQDNVSIANFIGEHLEVNKNNLSTDWHKIKTWTLKRFLVYTTEKGLNYLGDIHLSHLENYRSYLLERGAPKTTKNILMTISTMLSHAVKLNYIESNPCTKLDPIRGIKKSKKRSLSRSEIEKILKSIKGTYLHDLVLAGIYTGMRRQELIHLEHGDVDKKHRLIYVKNKEGFLTKSRKERVLPLHKKISKLFNHSKGYCFKNRGMKINKHAATRDFHKIVKEIGLTDVSLHTLRHTFISHSLMAGISPWEVGKWVGHSSVYITELYGHLCPDRREIDKLQI